MKRGSGILLAISSLPARYGIGTLGQGARDFVDRLTASGQTYWQILPASPTGYGDSPYQALSAFAGNPYFIDFDDLLRDGVLPEQARTLCERLFGGDGQQVDYHVQYTGRPHVLACAWGHAREALAERVAAFARCHAGWLDDYALFMALKERHHMAPFRTWPAALVGREPDALEEARHELSERIEYHRFVQYLFFDQWEKLRRYANERGIKIIGDMPIYVAPDSADAWMLGDLLDSRCVAGCPPDYFSQTGQLWGNPVYNWDAHKKTGYAWWKARMAHQLALYDYIRVDHFRGFEAYYAIPAEAETAQEGCWRKGPGLDFFEALKESLGALPLIAEDLGFLTQEVFDLLHETGFPGLKVLHFAFDADGGSIYLPFRYSKNCVVYTGTHDNDTTVGWYKTLDEADRRFLDRYLGGANEGNIHWQLIRLAMSSVANVCITPMQDVLGLPSAARMNTPQASQGCWRWRLTQAQLKSAPWERLAEMTRVYGRWAQE